jgi:hypothetical protein
MKNELSPLLKWNNQTHYCLGGKVTLNGKVLTTTGETMSRPAKIRKAPILYMAGIEVVLRSSYKNLRFPLYLHRYHPPITVNPALPYVWRVGYNHLDAAAGHCGAPLESRSDGLRPRCRCQCPRLKRIK